MFCLRTRPTNLNIYKNIYLCIATGIYIKKLSLSFYIGVGSQWHRGRCLVLFSHRIASGEDRTKNMNWGQTLLFITRACAPVFWGALQPAETMKHPGRNLGEEEFGIYLGTIFLRIGICIWNVDNLDQSSFRSGMLFDWSPEELWCRKLASNLATPAPHLHWWQLMVLFMATSCGRACGQNKDLTAVLIMNWILHSLAISCWGAAGNKVYYLAHE